MKKIILAVVLSLMLSITPAFASWDNYGGDGGNGGNGGVGGQGGTGGTGGAVTSTITNTNTPSYTNNPTFNNNPSATIAKDAVKNENSNNVGTIGSFSPGAKTFSPSAEATAVQGQGQDQKQAQGQLQGQGQGQLQGQAIVGSANTSNSNNAAQSTSIVFEAKREFAPAVAPLTGPNMTEFRGPYDKGNAGKVKPWVIKKSWSDEEANGMYSAFDGAECKLYPIAKASDATANLSVDKGDTVKAIIDCKGTSDFAVWGTAATKAMSFGATKIAEAAYAVTFSNKASGWNIGLGGGVSMVGQGSNDNKGGSVGGGTGFGSVETKPIENISVVFFIQ